LPLITAAAQIALKMKENQKK